jgi:hypothetical protein
VQRLLIAVAALLGLACSSSGSGTAPTATPTVASVSVTPPGSSIVAGTTAQLSATARTASGSVVSGQSVAWTSSNPAVASVSSGGLVSGVAVGGPVTVSAVVGGITGAASVTVTAVPVSVVTVTPASPSLLAGASVQLAAATKDANGAVLAGRAVSWSSSNVALATVSSTGRVTGVAAGGPVTITASSEGVNGTASVTIGTVVLDAVTNVSWLADANLPASNRFGLPLCTPSGPQVCVNASGSMSYPSAVAWVQAMNAANYLGHSNWQLPTTPITDAGASCTFVGPNGNSFGFKCASGALGSLYYNSLALKAPNTAVPIPANSVGPFSNFQPYLYWSATTTAALGRGTFSFNSGFQGSNTTPNYLYALPMIPGKIPGTPATVGTGLQVNPGGQTVYDPVTNVTWLANANVAATNSFGLPPCTDVDRPAICVNPDGAMNYNSVTQFIANMNSLNGVGYLGQSKWALAPLDSSCDATYACSAPAAGNPLGNLYYGQLGLSAGTPVVSTPSITVGKFKNVQPYLYWSCLGATIQSACDSAAPPGGLEWSFSFGNGFLGTDVLKNQFYVTAYFVGPAN